MIVERDAFAVAIKNVVLHVYYVALHVYGCVECDCLTVQIISQLDI